MASSDIVEELLTSTHLIRIPIPSHSSLIAHMILFKGPSILLWCGECSEAYGDSQLDVVSADPMLIEQHQPVQHTTRSQYPTARLMSEWAVAMTSAKTNTTSSTCLYRTNADLAQPMSARLSKRFSIPQIFLSLSLPQIILEGLEGPHASSEGARALLMIEGALKDIIKHALPQP